MDDKNTPSLPIPQKDQLNRINVRTAYKTEKQWKAVVNKAKTLLAKEPPKKFTDKWKIMGDSSFRKQMMESDNEAVVTIKITMALSKGQTIRELYWADNWELLAENWELYLKIPLARTN